MPPHLDIAHPERALAVHHASRLSQESLATLFAIDERLAGIVARTRETTIGLMRLVWWRDALAALDQAPPPAEPLLASAAALRPDRVSGTELSEMVQGWEALLDDPDMGGETLAIHARARGGQLFRLAGRVLGAEPAWLTDAGEGWALADLARHMSDPSKSPVILEAARTPLERVGAWPHRLRPLGMLTVLAREDVRRGTGALRPPGCRRRMLRVLFHQITGR
jgi:phytoene synthase